MAGAAALTLFAAIRFQADHSVPTDESEFLASLLPPTNETAPREKGLVGERGVEPPTALVPIS